MRWCTRVKGTPDENGVLRDVTLLDLSIVDDDHLIGRAPDGTWHFPGGQASGESPHQARSTTSPPGIEA